MDAYVLQQVHNIVENLSEVIEYEEDTLHEVEVTYTEVFNIDVIYI